MGGRLTTGNKEKNKPKLTWVIFPETNVGPICLKTQFAKYATVLEYFVYERLKAHP